MFGSIKTTMVEYFDKHYVAIAETVAATAIAAVTTAKGGVKLSSTGICYLDIF